MPRIHAVTVSDPDQYYTIADKGYLLQLVLVDGPLLDEDLAVVVSGSNIDAPAMVTIPAHSFSAPLPVKITGPNPALNLSADGCDPTSVSFYGAPGIYIALILPQSIIGRPTTGYIVLIEGQFLAAPLVLTMTATNATVPASITLPKATPTGGTLTPSGSTDPNRIFTFSFTPTAASFTVRAAGSNILSYATSGTATAS